MVVVEFAFGVVPAKRLSEIDSLQLVATAAVKLSTEIGFIRLDCTWGSTVRIEIKWGPTFGGKPIFGGEERMS